MKYYIMFSNGRKVEAEDTGLSIECNVEESFVAPGGPCYLLDKDWFLVTSIVLPFPVLVMAGSYVRMG